MKSVLLRFENVVTEQGGVKRLNRFSCLIGSGEMIGIMAINQQGIADLINIILYDAPVQSGKVFFGDELKGFKKRHKVSIIDRNVRLVQGLSIAENLFVFRENIKIFIIDHKMLEKEAQKILNEHNIFLNATFNTEKLSQLERIQIELLKEFTAGTKLIILRDLVTLLSYSELNQLIAYLKRLAAEGMTFLYIDVNPNDIFDQCGRLFIYDEGRIKKVLYFEQINRKALLPYCQTEFVHHVIKTQDKNPVLKLSCYDHNKKLLFTAVVSNGECLTIIDRDQQFMLPFFESFKNKKNACGWQIEFMNQDKDNAVFFIPENAIQTALFHDCSYMFNLYFSLDVKMKKSIFPSKVIKSIRKEFAEEIGDKYHLSSISGLDKYELLNLVYYRALLLRPDVIFIFQPFVDIDMDLQVHTLRLINQLKERSIGVVVLSSYLENLETVSDEVFRFDETDHYFRERS